MNIGKLKTEIDTDSEARGYSGMTNKQILDDGNELYKTRNKTILTGTEIINSVDQSEYAGLLAEDQDLMWKIVGIQGGVNPFGIEAALFVGIFGGGSVTIAALQALRVESISRWTDLGLGNVKEGHIEQARI
jgi:hypothetical protein